jgi:hypothetical protein
MLVSVASRLARASAGAGIVPRQLHASLAVPPALLHGGCTRSACLVEPTRNAAASYASLSDSTVVMRSRVLALACVRVRAYRVGVTASAVSGGKPAQHPVRGPKKGKGSEATGRGGGSGNDKASSGAKKGGASASAAGSGADTGDGDDDAAAAGDAASDADAGPLPDAKKVKGQMDKHIEFAKRELSKLRGATASPSKSFASCLFHGAQSSVARSLLQGDPQRRRAQRLTLLTFPVGRGGSDAVENPPPLTSMQACWTTSPWKRTARRSR